MIKIEKLLDESGNYSLVTRAYSQCKKLRIASREREEFTKKSLESREQENTRTTDYTIAGQSD